MRTTLHLVTAGDYLAYGAIYRERRIAELERQLAALGEEADFAAEGARLAAPAAEGLRTRPELLAALGRPKLRIEDRRPWLVWYGLAAQVSFEARTTQPLAAAPLPSLLLLLLEFRAPPRSRPGQVGARRRRRHTLHARERARRAVRRDLGRQLPSGHPPR